MSADGRYIPEQLPERPRDGKRPLPGLWVIRDTKTGKLVLDSIGELDLYSTEDGANGWIRGNKYLSEVGCGRP
ncbi:hypothetical protein GCM10010193_70870 [Kitasatospora atroaurantiaca]|uniref:Uncharacterized protein n=1 Tax=Kitasatospora atroaurantiaca TaxID=285545 RepID=A0A561ENK3_9ACTN|nr:hypothetical protein [Kitasatospora atroaurantiaca]TWE17172.1 hypothetical protein FB465_2179 [Kitasatospora atroaurantiaca]